MNCLNKNIINCFSNSDVNFDTLDGLIEDYIINHKTYLDKDINYYKGINLEKAILYSVFGKTDKRKKHPHQYRLKNSLLDLVSKLILENKKQLLLCKSFDEILTCINKITKSTKGFGPLAIYDTSLRIASNLGYMPEKIYLHCGTFIGAKNLGLNIKKGYLYTDELPREFYKINEVDIEACLCIYKDKLKFFTF